MEVTRAVEASRDVRTLKQQPASESSSDALRRRIRETIHAVEPGAQVILYGSRARGDALPDSDWDLLILVGGSVDHERKKPIWDRLYELELDIEELLCPVVLSRQDWDSPLYRAMPFRQNVDREGFIL